MPFTRIFSVWKILFLTNVIENTYNSISLRTDYLLAHSFWDEGLKLGIHFLGTNTKSSIDLTFDLYPKLKCRISKFRFSTGWSFQNSIFFDSLGLNQQEFCPRHFSNWRYISKPYHLNLTYHCSVLSFTHKS